jgi:hypothetical protein
LSRFLSRQRNQFRNADLVNGSTSVAALFHPTLDEGEVQLLLAKLQRNGVFVVHGTKVVYSLPD